MLYVVATPIGNLGDITLRALETLRRVELIAAEDTRHTLGLLTHYEIRKPVVSYYEHNKVSRGPELLARLAAGADIALVSDAGMPGISDPGQDLIRQAIEAGIAVTVVPGPVAGVTALVRSGLPTDRFAFEGFIGTDRKRRDAFFAMLLREERTVIAYEAPHRICKTLTELAAHFRDAGTPDRRIAVCRELTKAFEEVLCADANALCAHFTVNPPRGEFVLVIEGAPQPDEPPACSDVEIYSTVQSFQAGGLSPKEALRAACEQLHMPRNAVYAACERVKADPHFAH